MLAFTAGIFATLYIQERSENQALVAQYELIEAPTKALESLVISKPMNVDFEVEMMWANADIDFTLEIFQEISTEFPDMTERNRTTMNDFTVALVAPEQPLELEYDKRGIATTPGGLSSGLFASNPAMEAAETSATQARLYGPYGSVENVEVEISTEFAEVAETEGKTEVVATTNDSTSEDSTEEGKVFYTIPSGNSPFVMPILGENGILSMLQDENFYHAKAVGGIRPEAEEATEILLGYYQQIPVEERFTPEQIAGFMVREAKYWSSVDHYSKDNPSGEFVINLNTVSGSDNGGLQLRSVCYNEVLVDKDGCMPFTAEDMKRLRELALGNADMRKNILLPTLIFQFWHQRYTVSDSSLAVKAGKFNAGPTGYKNGGGRSYGRGVEKYHKMINERVLLAQQKADDESRRLAGNL